MNISVKNTALLIDTNIVLDFFLGREPFVECADEIMRYCIIGKIQGYLASHTLLNAFYITRKQKSIAERKEFLLMLCEKFIIVGVNKQTIMSALQNEEWDDLEDGLQIQCAIIEDLNYIITRDPKGFENSKIKVLSPEEFLNLMKNK